MKKHLLKLTALLLCFPAFSVFAEQTVDIEIRGIRGERAIRNTKLNVGLINKEEMDGSDRYKQLVTEAVDKGLRVFGYYDSSVSFELKKRKSRRDLLIAHVKPGEPSRIAGTDVKIEGEAAQDENFQALRKNLPKEGELVEHQKYDDYKSSISTLALARGYLDGKFTVSRLEISPETHQAWWRMLFDSGVRYHYGEIKFSRSQIRDDYLQNMLKIQRGDPYLLTQLSGLTNDFSSTGWFGSVLLQPHVDEQNKVVNLEVLLNPRKKNAVELGVGFATDTGPHLQIGWTKPWINNRGHSFRTNLYVSSPKQTLEASYKIPLLKNPLNYYYEFSGGLENEDKNDTKTTAITLAGLRYWNNNEGWQYFAGVRARYDKFTQADIDDKTLLVYPTGGFNRTRLRGGIFPTWGDSQKITVDVAYKGLLSDVSFYKVQASTGWIRTYAENHRIITRAEIGYLHTKDINKIPPTLRFFAGGDRSVRGYGYKKISPKDHNNKLVGGSRLLAGSFEYQYQVYPAWWGATFVDTGLAANNFSNEALRYGAGVGVRWASPVGAIKFDIATPIRDKDNSKNIQFYIGLGTEI
ncbi:autotransporter assembly complex protein TamA [Rodentibacter caecimuris]|uniref:autotransporter assembly complex protein TamA n=1 Tax=Rodentibacter caecimuris TaxID=1796644 RepID=UPI002248EDF3|nr:autotransporter assembly complex family protein [Rodentibacter heylii]MCX2961731.1 autotransporter assembly complex protein TamA [Rodentibacter heylii]